MTQAKQQPASMGSAGAKVSTDCVHAIEQHYYLEARLLQNEDYRRWLDELVALDIHYWMPIYEQRYRRDKRGEPTPDDAAIYNDDRARLSMRIERLYSGQVWMEDPPSRIRYLISNVEAYHTDMENEYAVYCNFSIHRHRRQTEHTEHIGGREDLLRRVTNGFQLVRRKIILDARVTADKNLYFFA